MPLLIERLRTAGLLVGLAAGLLHCGASGDVSSDTVAQPIVGGTQVDAQDTPVLFLQSPAGGCSAVLVAPQLAVTARHCVAQNTPGPFSCTASGDLIPNAGTAGQIGVDDPPSSLAFFTNAHLSAAIMAGAPDALGAQIISTQTPTACRDDLALVVLDRAVPGIAPASVRISTATQPGEDVSVWGYGLTEQRAPTALRSRTGVAILGVGPDTPSTVTQPAPVRAVRTGPVTCQGDSGGPFLSQAGAVIAIVSLGSQAGAAGPFCSPSSSADTIGPRLNAYRSLILSAFQAAGATPVEEPTDQDGAAAIDSEAPPEEASIEAADDTGIGDMEQDDTSATDGPTQGPQVLGPVSYRAIGGSCAVLPGSDAGAGALIVLGIAWTAVSARRRRR